MSRSPKSIRLPSSDFDGFANDVAMAVWNRIAELPQFQNLKPADYPELYETLQKVLRPYTHLGRRDPHRENH